MKNRFFAPSVRWWGLERTLVGALPVLVERFRREHKLESSFYSVSGPFGGDSNCFGTVNGPRIRLRARSGRRGERGVDSGPRLQNRGCRCSPSQRKLWDPEWILGLNGLFPSPFVGLSLAPKNMGNGWGLPPLNLIQSTVARWKIDFSLPANAGGSVSEAVRKGDCKVSLNRDFEAVPGRFGETPTNLGL